MNRIKVSLMIITFLLTLNLCACNETLAEFEGGYEASFRGHMLELNGEYAALEDIYQGENYLKLFKNGEGVIAFSGDEEEISWSKTSDGYSIIFLGESCATTFKDGILTVEIDGGIVTYVANGAAEPEIPTRNMQDYDTDLSSPFGTYHGLTVNQFGAVSDMSVFYGNDSYIQLNTNGMGVLNLGGSKQNIAWDLKDGVLTIADTNGINSMGVLSEGVIVLDYMGGGLQLAFAKTGAEP